MDLRPLPHIAFQVRDQDRAVRFYRDVLGMDVIGGDRRETRLRCGDVTFYVEPGEPGRMFLAFETDDIDAARAELVEAGCTVGEFDGEGFLVSDPFGLSFYLSGRA